MAKELTTITLEKGIKAKLKSLAKKSKRSLSSEAEMAIENHVKRFAK